MLYTLYTQKIRGRARTERGSQGEIKQLGDHVLVLTNTNLVVAKTRLVPFLRAANQG